MRLALLIGLTIYYCSLFAQYRFDHLDVKDGLSQSSVNDILQDSQGFMWFATQDGLNRYDGHDFLYYNIDTSPPTAGNFLWSLAEDPAGNIWTASQFGATRLDWENGRSTNFYFDKSKKKNPVYNQVSKVLIQEDDVLISFDGRGTYKIKFNDYADSTLVELGDSELWYSPDDEVRRYLYNEFSLNGKRITVRLSCITVGDESISYPPGYLVSNFKGEYYPWDSGFFLGTVGGLLFFDLVKKAFITTCIIDPVNDIAYDQTLQNLMVATDHGLILFDVNEAICKGKILSGTKGNQLSNSLVSSIYKSQNGLFWLGTANGGINVWDPLKNRFRFLDKEHGLTGKPVWSVLRTVSDLFIGTDMGLYGTKIDAKSYQPVVSKILALEDNERACSLFEYKDTIWVGTNLGRVFLYVPGKGGFAKETTLPSNPVISDMIARNDTIWISTHDGLFLLDRSMQIIDHLTYAEDPHKYPTNYYLSAYKSADNTLWFGSNTGFSIHHPDGTVENILYDEASPETSPNHYFVSGFAEDPDGFMWMSTFGGGVSRFDRKSKTFMHLTTNDGLANNTCASIEAYDNLMFVATNKGLSQIEINTHTINSYTVNDGLLNNEFAISSSFLQEDELYFGAVDGLVFFEVKDLQKQALNAPSISELEVNYESKPYTFISDGRLDLQPSDKVFSLSFTDLTFRNKDQIHYEYLLDGFNDSWISATVGNRRATYSLSPGEYVFKVRTVLNGVASDPAELLIVRHPAFYQTWWFYVLATLLSIASIALLSRYYSHQQLKKRLRRLELKQKVQSERERISRDLHDNVGSQITYIATSIDNLSDQESSEELKELGDFTRDTIRQLRETIWVINHDEVSLEELKNKVVDYLSTALKYHPQIQQKVTFSPSNKRLNPSWAINVFRIIQEAVNNAIKHSGASKIEVSLSLSHENKLAIRDNGAGFNGEERDGHFGLVNMRNRALDLGGKFEVESSERSGTLISVSNFEIGQMT